MTVCASAALQSRTRRFRSGFEDTKLRASLKGQIRFEDRQPKSGVDFVLNNSPTNDKPIIDSILGGVALLDFDNDGFLDIFFTNGARIPGLVKEDESFSNRLYHNNHNGTFSDVTTPAGVSGRGYSIGVAAGDFNNDGWTDLYVAGVNENLLYRNNGDGTFSDATKKAGVSGQDATGKKLLSVAALWVDYDNDGNLDLFVVNYVDWSPDNNKVCGDSGKRLTCSPAMYKGLPNLLYLNQGDGTFTNISESSELSKHLGKGMSAAIADYDDDGFMDVFVTNDSERNFLFRNSEGQRFVEVGVESGVGFPEDGLPIANMGVDFRDINDDGRPDLHITALASETYPLFLNDGAGLFSDVTVQSGIGLTAKSMSGWGNGIYDFDNDGHKDIFAANSHVSENIEVYRHYKYRLPNAVFQNQGTGAFVNVTSQAGAAINTAAVHRGCAFGDLDNDGKVDVVVSVIGDKPELLYNTSAGGAHWIEIQTEGRQTNSDGIGTRIKLTQQSGEVQYNQVTTSVGYASASDKRVHFGLGKNTRIREIELRWPSGKVQVVKDVAADQVLKVKEE
jgi:enediyne biosynthesis protein E4